MHPLFLALRMAIGGPQCLGVHPPLLVEGHGGGRGYAMRYVRGRYRQGEQVFAGIDEPEETTFSPGPAMRYAKVDPHRVRVFHPGHRLGTWRLSNAKVVAWWSLPVVVRGARVDALQPRGRLKRLPLDGRDLRTVLPSRSGALFALYSTKSHWRVLRHSAMDDRWTPWLPGAATDFAPTPDRLFVAVGGAGVGYREYVAAGPGALWSYAFGNGASRKERDFDQNAELVFDDPWLRSGHVASLLRWHSNPNPPARWFPFRTEILALTDAVRPLAKLPTGWEVHALDRVSGTFLGLHIDRKNMGFDLREVSLATGYQKVVGEDVDALDVSTESPYSPLVDDVPKPLWSAKVAGYRLVKWGWSGDVETLRLLDPRGRVVTSIRDFHARPIEQDGKVQVTRIAGVPTIVLEAWTGGAHGSNAYFVWRLGRHPRCLLAYDKNNVSDEHDFEFVDLDGDGVPEIRSWYDGFAYTVRVSFWPDLPVVLRLERGRYVDRTARYRKLLDRAEHDEWAALLASDRRAPFRPWSYTLGAGVNLVALAELRGTQRRTWSRLHRLVRPETFEWLRKRETAIAAVERGRVLRYRYPRAYDGRTLSGPTTSPYLPQAEEIGGH